jgi:hypothetical protein
MQRKQLRIRRETMERLREPPPPPDPAEELLKEWPELGGHSAWSGLGSGWILGRG